ncbi:hypothetical protein HY933_03950 [Candidatus Falkowbacteria bacterium]|nr:hypothetical protein [Candidatus Falkowbacteria bacterium]
MTWIVLSLSAAFLWSWVNVVDKNVVSKLVKDVYFPLTMWGVLGLIGSVLVLAFHFRRCIYCSGA